MSRALGIDIGGTNIQSVVVNATGRVVEEIHLPTANHATQLIEQVKSCIDQLGAANEAWPVGVASPGLATRDNGIISWMRGRLEVIEGLDWSSALGRPVSVLNDAHAATMGEAWVGAAAGRRHVVLLTLGTGVGGGVIVDGRLLQGATGRAGHFGHITVDASGGLDIVNTPGSLEDAIGNHSLSKRSGGRFSKTHELLAAARAGDTHATCIWQRSIDQLAAGITSLINSFDPQVVLLGGGIAQAGEALFGPLRYAMKRVEWRPTGSAVPILPAVLGDRAGAIGAARFAVLVHESAPLGQPSTSFKGVAL
ncbi:MAG: ROK family protein [Planctomycetota bacterium]